MERIDEGGLSAFRRERLSADAILGLLQQHVWLLIRLGLGIGKSFAIDGLLRSPALYERFDLVLVFAPSWAILRERCFLKAPESVPARIRILEPRPEKRCGSYAADWKRLEQQGCAALAKATLCTQCRAATPDDPCPWPDQMRDMEGVHLVAGTERQLLLNRALVTVIKSRTNARRVLVILDEARFLDGSFEVSIEPDHLRQFEDVLVACFDQAPAVFAPWLDAVRELLMCPPRRIRALRFKLPIGLVYAAEKLQRIGVHLHGDRFRFIGYELFQFQYSKRSERHKRMDGTVIFTARPYMQTHLIVASAHLGAEYAAHRLGVSHIDSPFESVCVRHSGTRVINLRNRSGAQSYFPANRKQILDTTAAILRRNIFAGRTTILIARQKSKPACAEYLRNRLGEWGVEARFLLEGDALPVTPDASAIPFIHYGVLGVNDYSEYQCAICVNSYYVSDRTLREHLAEFEKAAFGPPLRIVSGVELLRRVELVDPSVPADRRLWLANEYLRRLEVDPVLQAVGRVRPLTQPREVVTFQMADLSEDIGPVEEVRSLVALRRALGVPDPKEIDHAIEVEQIRAALAEGLTVDAAAARIGMSRATAFRRLEEAKSLNNPNSSSIRESETTEGAGGAP